MMITKLKRIVVMLFRPTGIWPILTGLLGIGLLTFVFMTKRDQTLFGVLTYPITLYGITVLMINMPSMMLLFKKIIAKNKFGNRYLTDITLRARLSLYQGFTINLCFVSLYIYTSFRSGSTWFGAIAVYYIILSLMRFYLLQRNKTVSSLISQLKTYRFCGYLMFVLNLGMAGMIVQMIWQNKSFVYSEITIYAAAIYAFYTMILSIVSMISIRRTNNPILSAAKQLGFSVAVMSMFTLQTVMVSHFGTENYQTRQLMNLISGSVVLIIVFGTAVVMVSHANHRIKQEQTKIAGK